ncbi:MAG: rhodanese-like domain-containing protein [Myxococcota bacterium]
MLAPSRVLPLLLLLLACGSSAEVRPASGTEARGLVARGATLLDVRTGGEFDQGHAEGALNVPVDELSARLAEIPKDRPVVTYCMAGGRSGRAAALLAGEGYEVHDLGSLAKWNEAAPAPAAR